MVSKRVRILPAVAEKTIEEYIYVVTHIVGVELSFSYCEGTEIEGEVSLNKDTMKNIKIAGQDYKELMKSNPSWAPKKPANVFRVEDLFAYVTFKEQEANK